MIKELFCVPSDLTGFFKVGESNGGVCIGTFFNPTTMESFSKKTWDIDDVRLEQDKVVQYLRFMTINQEVRRHWLNINGVIQVGDTVEVVKGRKLPIGKTGIVSKIVPYYDCYRRWKCDYIHFSDGTRTNINNCKLIS